METMSNAAESRWSEVKTLCFARLLDGFWEILEKVSKLPAWVRISAVVEIV